MNNISRIHRPLKCDKGCIHNFFQFQHLLTKHISLLPQFIHFKMFTLRRLLFQVATATASAALAADVSACAGALTYALCISQ